MTKLNWETQNHPWKERANPEIVRATTYYLCRRWKRIKAKTHTHLSVRSRKAQLACHHGRTGLYVHWRSTQAAALAGCLLPEGRRSQLSPQAHRPGGRRQCGPKKSKATLAQAPQGQGTTGDLGGDISSSNLKKGATICPRSSPPVTTLTICLWPFLRISLYTSSTEDLYF